MIYVVASYERECDSDTPLRQTIQQCDSALLALALHVTEIEFGWVPASETVQQFIQDMDEMKCDVSIVEVHGD